MVNLRTISYSENWKETSQVFNNELSKDNATEDTFVEANVIECHLSSNISQFTSMKTLSFIIPVIRDEVFQINNKINNANDTQNQNISDTNAFPIETCDRFSCCKIFKSKSFDKFINSNQLKVYQYLFDFLRRWKECYHALITDPMHKKNKFNLQRVINTPINSLSNINIMHLFDKMKYLEAFFDGKDIEVAGRIVSINICAEGKYFCMDLFAKKVICQAEIQIALQPESAFPLAALTVLLCQKYRPLLKLLLAHFYKKCPYLVPYYAPHIAGQTEEQHYRDLGYLYDDKVEKQDYFLKRMSGIVRFYAAIIQTPAILNKPHPYGVKSAWMWLNHLLNLEPCSDITATVLVNFFEVAGYFLQKSYGKQFYMMMKKLADEFLPKIKSVTLAGSGGPLHRLECLIEKYFKEGSIPQPSGVLDFKFISY